MTQTDVGAPHADGGADPHPEPRATKNENRLAAPPSPWAEGVAVWTGRVLVVASLVMLVSFLLRPAAPRLTRAIDMTLGFVSLPHPTLFSVVLTAVIAGAVMRRLRAALWFIVLVWVVPTAVVGAVVAIGLGIGGSVLDDTADTGSTTVAIASAVFATVVAVILISARRAFVARVRPGAWWRAVLVLLAGLAVSVLVSYLLLDVMDDTSDDTADRVNWALSVATGTSPHDPPFATDAHGPHWLVLVASVISTLALIAAIVVFLRGRSRNAAEDLEDELHTRRLLLQYPSEDSLAYFATRDDRSEAYSANGEAAVSYRVVGSVALAAGDPIGDPQHWDDAIAHWLDRVRRYGWVPAATALSERGARAYAKLGMSVVVLGDESVIDTRTFSLDAPALAPVRHAIAKPHREGYTVRISRAAEIDPEDLAQLVHEAEEWRHGEERGYSMSLSRFGDPRDPRQLIVSAYDAEGRLRGVLGFVPWGRTGVSLDVMRRSPEAVNGVTELMVSQLATRGRALGVDKISLNFAMLRGVFEQGERVGASFGARLQRRVLLLGSRWWQLDSLYKSNQKYDPQWLTRYLATGTVSQRTAALIAYGRAEGFVPEGPSWTRRRDRAPELNRSMSREVVAAVLEQESRLRMPDPPARRLTDQQRARVDKLETLRAAGMEPYPVGVPRTHQVGEVTEELLGQHVSVAGRVVRLRDLGGVVFAVLRENSRELQVIVTADRAGSRPDLFRRTVDLADTISVTGDVTRSRTGELSLHASAWTMASKALTPPPDKFRGLVDADSKARLRHVDLALNAAPTRLLVGRSVAVRAMRDVFAAHDYLEVETPILQTVHGGANARPFLTHINAYDMDLYLRIAPELFLKRLAVGGFQRVFEIGRNFRNEGVDYKHNPEFTSLEAYQAYADYTVMRHLTREVIIAAAVAVHGRPIAIAPDGSEIDLDVEWPVVTCHKAVSRAVGEEVTPDTPIERVRELCELHDIAFGPDETHGLLVAELYDELVEGQTTFPTFYTDFPKETSPLTREHRTDPRLAERWDLVAFGSELGTAYSELVNPVDQRDRLTRQSMLAALGDPEAMEIDEEFLSALEFGLPPTGGLGLGVDRCYMFVVGATIRETLTFPFTKPQSRT
ncbi:bifunctional lysylphosphatidylglycerol synthetase/lysine--tRNA ligase LysX [Miniimonas arenae]|uniref:bifunctional lysylphosphatidylglycerol synthetase/lysine--tRNA ligase LysX n=1 Tax=Miniimonas arenae TaxID=676201 RepID=UPI0028AD871C|nr:bifunctional lysylphosphatidylglycerol synthetase/lysine--tRNA ligase LysX [Miniimonas arenae]